MVWDKNFKSVVTCKSFQNILNDLRMQYLQKYPKLFLNFDNTLVIGDGESHGENPYLVRVGIKGLDLESDRPIKEKDFVAILAAFYHEMRHVEQYDELFRQSGERNSIMAISYVADMYNDYYYKKNYFSRPYEIDAMQFGIMDAYAYCSDLFGEEKANQLICNYVNRRRTPGHKFLSKNNCFNRKKIIDENFIKYDSVYDILDDYDKVFIESIHRHRRYNLNRFLNPEDSVANYFRDNREYQPQLFLKEPDGLNQDKMAASMSINYGNIQSEVKDFPGVNVSHPSVLLDKSKQRWLEREIQRKEEKGSKYIKSPEMEYYEQQELMKKEEAEEQQKNDKKLEWNNGSVNVRNHWIEIDFDESDNDDDDKGLDF